LPAITTAETRSGDGATSTPEWLFRILKRVFGYTKVRFRGIVKNHHWLLAAFALVNLYQYRKRSIPQDA
jgi:IS5 family transposase